MAASGEIKTSDPVLALPHSFISATCRHISWLPMRRVHTLYWIFALGLVFSAKTCNAKQILLPQPIEGKQKVSQTETLHCAGVSSGELRQYPFGLDLLDQLRVSLLRTILPFFKSMI
jgi:hypothetical protein